MANSHGSWTSDVRPSAKTPWKQDTHAREVFRGIDRLDEAVSTIMDPDDAQALTADWETPLFYRNTAGDAWLAEWLDNTDTGNITKRMKSGTTKSAATPSSKTDGVVVGGGGFIG